jgi:hypothetical protein
MRKLGLQLFGTFIIVILVSTSIVKSVPQVHSPRSERAGVVIISTSGQKLATLFDGLPHNPRFSLDRIVASNRQRSKCGQGASKPDIMGRLFGGVTVYAFSCPDNNGNCQGNGWVQYTNYCNTGGPCSGSYQDTRNDPYEGDCYGFSYDGTYCGTAPTCGCQNYQCYTCE